MKLYKNIVGAFFVLLAVGCASPKSAERAAETQKAVAEALANRHLRIEIRSMNPFRYASRTVSYGFYLAINGDTLESRLPYIGQVHQTTAVSPEGLNFDATIIGYSETRPKKDLTRIELNVRTREDLYHYIVEVYDSGSAYIRVRAQNRDSISFDGNVSL